MKNVLIITMLIAVVLIVSAIFFIDYKLGKAVAQACEDLRMVASNQEVVAYLKRKIKPLIDEPKFVELVGVSAYIDDDRRSKIFNSLEIDWEYVGLNRNNIRLFFGSTVEAHLENKYYNYVDIKDGRNSILIYLGGDLNSAIAPDRNSEMEKISISKDVYIYCGGL